MPVHRLFSLFLLVAFSGAGLAAQEAPATRAAPVPSDESSVLIVYLSRTKNTEAVARMIHEFTGGRMVAVETEIPYPEDYRKTVAQVDQENETGHLPSLKTNIADIQHYETIFVGFPTWDMTLPPPMKSFLRTHDLEGKTVVPFNTNAGYGAGSGYDVILELCPMSRVLSGFSIKGGIERDGVLFVMEGKKAESTRDQIHDWLRAMGIPAHTSDRLPNTRL